jgi:hypothetical protein
MSRTLRRRNCHHEYRDVLYISSVRAMLDPVSPAGRKAVALYHSDNHETWPIPRWWRRECKVSVKTKHERMIRRWLNHPEFDPVFAPRHDKGYFW